MLSDLLSQVRGLIPALVTTFLIIAIYKGTAYLLTKKVTSGNRYALIRQVLLFLILFIGFFFIMLSLPLESGLKGQILSLMGIVLAASISLSSTTLLGNAIAALNLGLVDSFKVGDFIHCGDKFGRVTTKGLFHTQIQTENKDLMTLPNLYLSTNPITVTRSSGTIVSAEVSLGYDVARTKVENVLIEAAKSIGLQDPFVFIMALGDYSIVYKVHGMLGEAYKVLSYRSDLKEAMLDKLHDAGIEIVSPSFMNQRQVNDQIFLSKSRRDTKKDTGQTAESVIFDKAEKAEAIELRQGEVEALKERIDQLKTERKEMTETTLIDQRIEKLENDRQELQKAVDAEREQFKKDD